MQINNQFIRKSKMITKVQSIVTLVILVSVQIKSQTTLMSPCPSVFEYDHTLQYPGRWYGVIKVSSEHKLSGLWLNIDLDGHAEIMKSCVGSVTRRSRLQYEIKNENYIINPGEKINIQIYVEYNVAEAPELTYIAVNGRNICEKPNRFSIPLPGNYAEFGTDSKGCPYRPGHLEESSDKERPEMSTEKTQTTRVTTTVTPNQNTDDSDDPFGGPISFVLPSVVTNTHNNSELSHCGRIYSKTPLTVGEPTQLGQWPWQVFIKRRIKFSDVLSYHEFSEKFICSGTIISTLHIITAAHCVTVHGRVPDEEAFLVLASKIQLNYHPDTHEKFISVNTKDIVVHPEYDHYTFKNNLAILKATYRRITFSMMMQPACLWPRRTTAQGLTKFGTVAGWGFDTLGEPHKELTTVEMSEMDSESCLRANDPSLARYLSDKMYCAKHVNGTRKCHNDSGGGMLIKMKNRWYLRGVLSYYYSPELQTDCRSYALFTVTVKHLPWIKQHRQTDFRSSGVLYCIDTTKIKVAILKS